MTLDVCAVYRSRSNRGASRRRAWLPLFFTLPVAACAAPPQFPTGGEVRATGHCAHDDTPHDPDSPSPAPPTDDGYGYQFAGLTISLFFEDGVLTQFEAAKWAPAELGQGSRPVERWRTRGHLEERATEGQWHDVRLSAVSPIDKGPITTGRFRVRGRDVDVSVSGSELTLECAWR